MTDSANLIHTLLQSTAGRVVCGAIETSAADLRVEVGRWAGHLLNRHTAGSRIGLISGNDLPFIVGYLACLSAGMVAVPMNPLSPDSERARDLASVDLAEVLVGPSVPEVLSSVATVAPALAATVLEPGNALGQPIDPVVDAAVVEPDHAAVLLFTSGTAGPSKPAILTHRNLRASLLSVRATGVDLESGSQATVAVVPLFHVLGLNVIMNLALAIGATIVLHDRFDPELLLAQVAEHNVTVLAGPPNMWRSIAAMEPERTTALATVNVALSGAAGLDPTIARTIRERHGLDLREGYGLTETAAIVCSGFGADHVEIGSVGPVMPGVECRLVDADGADVLIGDVGEVWVRGPMVSPGYWNDDAATERTRTDDGWFRTGDLAIVDDSGHLSISGRTKDLVIVAGFNVHPGEVEWVLQSHPSVEAAAAIGVPDSATGERVNAFVTLAEGSSPDVEETLRTYCATHLARYKVPKRISVVDRLPIGVAGKLRRRDLST